MRVEHLDRLTASVQSHESAETPRIQRSPTLMGTVFGRASDVGALESEGLRPVEAPARRREDVEQAVDDANALADTFPDHRIAFAVDGGSEQMVVRVIDNDTEEVVRQVPPQEFLEMVAKVEQMVGLFFDRLA